MRRYLALLLLPMVSPILGCARNEVFTRPRRADALPLAQDTPFRFCWIRPGRDDIYRGRIAFVADVRAVPAVVAKLRRAAFEMGGNLIYQLRCRNVDDVPKEKLFNIEQSHVVSGRHRLHCVGQVYHGFPCPLDPRD